MNNHELECGTSECGTSDTETWDREMYKNWKRFVHVVAIEYTSLTFSRCICTVSNVSASAAVPVLAAVYCQRSASCSWRWRNHFPETTPCRPLLVSISTLTLPSLYEWTHDWHTRTTLVRRASMLVINYSSLSLLLLSGFHTHNTC